MKVRVYSDIHLDWYAGCLHTSRVVNTNDTDWVPPFWYPPVLPDDKDTILILVGDLWTGTKFIEYAGFSWIGLVAPRFKEVLIVLGNHDYWPTNDKLTITQGANKCNAMLQDFGYDNVKVLDCDTFEVEDYIFVGCTLWTDMNKFDPLTMLNMSKYMAYDGKIVYKADEHSFERFTSERWVHTHINHRDYIKIVVEQNRDKKIFVITHHVPLMSLVHPEYANDRIGNGYYFSDLSDIILDNPHITHWVSGHTHKEYDVMFEGCRMINNSVGYLSEHKEQEGLVQHNVFDI